MIKVKLTTGYCNPPVKRTISCETLKYFSALNKVTMYNKKGKVIAYAFLEDWLEISYIDNNEQEHFIKRKDYSNEKTKTILK